MSFNIISAYGPPSRLSLGSKYELCGWAHASGSPCGPKGACSCHSTVSDHVRVQRAPAVFSAPSALGCAGGTSGTVKDFTVPKPYVRAVGGTVIQTSCVFVNACWTCARYRKGSVRRDAFASLFYVRWTCVCWTYVQGRTLPHSHVYPSERVCVCVSECDPVAQPDETCAPAWMQCAQPVNLRCTGWRVGAPDGRWHLSQCNEACTRSVGDTASRRTTPILGGNRVACVAVSLATHGVAASCSYQAVRSTLLSGGTQVATSIAKRCGALRSGMWRTAAR